jgi:transposase
VKLVTDEGYTKREAASSLGVRPDLVARWTRELEESDTEAFRGNGNLTTDQERIRDLENQVRHLKMEKEILKKATVFFAKESK